MLDLMLCGRVREVAKEVDDVCARDGRLRDHVLLAAKMAITPPGLGTPTADWIRLGHPESSFQLVTDWLGEGGMGFIQPLWPGPSDTSVLPATDDMADPDGSDDGSYLGLFASLIAETGH